MDEFFKNLQTAVFNIHILDNIGSLAESYKEHKEFIDLLIKLIASKMFWFILQTVLLIILIVKFSELAIKLIFYYYVYWMKIEKSGSRTCPIGYKKWHLYICNRERCQMWNIKADDCGMKQHTLTVEENEEYKKIHYKE